MATIKQINGARTAQTITGIATLGAGTYLQSAAISTTTNQPLDVIVELEVVTTNAVAGNKQVVVFIQESMDGTNFRTGPASGGTATTDEPNLRFVGTIPMNTTGVTQRGMFSVAQALGYVPTAFKVMVKNDVGVQLTGGGLYTTEISNTVV